MKKIIYLFLIIFLTGCSKTIDISYEVEIVSYHAYAININTKQIECVEIDYQINDEFDSFYLYTTYQNQLPIGYTTPAHTNIGILECYHKGLDIYYVVDNFILFVDDLSVFQQVLSETNKLYGMGNAYFVFNGKIIS